VNGRILRRAITQAGNASGIYGPGSKSLIHRLLSARLTLVCDATVANRYIRLRLGNGTVIYSAGYTSTVVTAGNTGVLVVGGFRNYLAVTLIEGSLYGLDIDQSMVSVPGATGEGYMIDVVGGVVGDALTGTLSVLEVPW